MLSVRNNVPIYDEHNIELSGTRTLNETNEVISMKIGKYGPVIGTQSSQIRQHTTYLIESVTRAPLYTYNYTVQVVTKLLPLKDDANYVHIQTSF